MALAPLFLSLASPRVGFRRAFVLGLVAGGVYFAGTLYWVSDTVVTYGGLARPVATLVAGLLVAYLALYVALAAGVIAAAARRVGPGALLLAPVVWVATEYARGRMFTGFPWVFLGYSQATVLPVIQAASLAGVYLVSALVALPAAGLAYAAAARRRGPVALAVIVAIVGAAVWWGERRIAAANLLREGTPVRVGVVQGSVPQHQKWDPAYGSEIFHRYLKLTRNAASRGATFILWPETATPFFFENEPAGRAAIERFARETRTTLLFGSDQVEPGTPPKYYNAAFLVEPTGRAAAVYRKMHLVPFGEYVPLKSILFFASPLVESVSDFSTGDELVLLPVGSHHATTAICYEIVFPHLARAAILAGSQLLTTVTNDAWYGWSSAAYQHFEQATVRAVEQGRYLLRAANTGISAVVDPYGRVAARTPLFEPAVLVAQARFLDRRTAYGTMGDSFAWACVAVSVLLVLGARGAGGPR